MDKPTLAQVIYELELRDRMNAPPLAPREIPEIEAASVRHAWEEPREPFSIEENWMKEELLTGKTKEALQQIENMKGTINNLYSLLAGLQHQVNQLSKIRPERRQRKTEGKTQGIDI